MGDGVIPNLAAWVNRHDGKTVQLSVLLILVMSSLISAFLQYWASNETGGAGELVFA